MRDKKDFNLNDGWQKLLQNKNIFSSSWVFADIQRFLIASSYTNSIDKKNPKVLDIGCSSFNFLDIQQNYYRSHGTKMIKYLGVDMRDMTKELIELKKKLSPQLKSKFIKADLIEDFGKISKYKTFDVILALEVIEHIQTIKVKDFINCVYNLLDDNGLFIISTPIHFKKEPMYYPDDHYFEFEYEELNRIFNFDSQQFEVITEIGIHPNAKLLKNMIKEEDEFLNTFYKSLLRKSKQGTIINNIIAMNFIEACECIFLVLKRRS